MKDKQAMTFNRMRAALLTISRGYMTPDQMRRNCERGEGIGLGYEEELGMAYENIQETAASAVSGVRAMPLKATREGAQAIVVAAEGGSQSSATEPTQSAVPSRHAPKANDPSTEQDPTAP